MNDEATQQIARKLTETVARTVGQMPEDDVDEVELMAACIDAIQSEVGRRLQQDELYVVIRMATRVIVSCVESGSPLAWAIATIEKLKQS